MEQVKEHPKLKGRLQAPSLAYEEKMLYGEGVFAAMTRDNLDKKMNDFVFESGKQLFLNDKGLERTQRLMIFYERDADSP